jgi:hypothetical protein
MPTVAQVISDIELQVYQGAPSDEDELPKDQIKYWIGVDLNSLVATEINGKIERQEMVPSIYVRRASCEPLEAEANDCGDDCLARISFELDDEILVINKDMGVVRVVTSENQQVLRASSETLDIINLLRFAKPSNSNLVYSRQGNLFYIEGLKEVDIPFEEVHVYYVPKQDIMSLSDTDEILVSDITLPMLISSVANRARMQIYGSDSDKTNNGYSDISAAYHQKIKRDTDE